MKFTNIRTLAPIAALLINALAGCGAPPQDTDEPDDSVASQQEALTPDGERRTPVDNPPFDFNGCGQTVHVEFPVNQETAKITTLGDGTVIQDIRGKLIARLSVAATGVSILENASGPAKLTIFTSGEALLEGRGRTLLLLPPADATANGVPEIFINNGQLDVFFGTTGRTILKRTGKLTNLCPILGAHTAR